MRAVPQPHILCRHTRGQEEEEAEAEAGREEREERLRRVRCVFARSRPAGIVALIPIYHAKYRSSGCDSPTLRFIASVLSMINEGLDRARAPTLLTSCALCRRCHRDSVEDAEQAAQLQVSLSDYDALMMRRACHLLATAPQ